MYDIYFCLFVFSSSVLASREFVYSRSWLNHCRVCSKKSCWVPTTQSSCTYDEEAAASLTPADEEEPKSAGPVDIDVDDTILDIMENAPFTEYKDCIPFISQRTDCSKENICIGCKRCSCTLHGNWKCIQVQQCRPSPNLVIDHQTLSTAIEKMNYEITGPRYKRSLLNKTLNIAPFWEIIESFHSNKIDNRFSFVKKLTTEPTRISTTCATEEKTDSTTEADDVINIDSENLAFEEVLNNIAVQKKTKQKLFLNESMMDNLKHEDINNSYFDLADIFNEFGDNNNYTNEIEDSVTQLAVDLLTSVTSKPNKWINDTPPLNKTTLHQEVRTLLSKSELYNNQNYSADLLSNSKTNDINTISNHVYKREILNISKTTENNTIHTKTGIAELQNEVFEPLNNLIKEKQKEIEELTFVKERISKYLISVKEINKTSNNNNQTKVESHFSIYKVEINPEPSKQKGLIYDTKDLKKYIQKVESDIYTTINDVNFLKKLSPQHYTKDLKSIEDALINYARKEGTYKTDITQSRRTDSTYDADDLMSNIKLLLKNVDQGILANKTLSVDAKKIIRRILSHNCFKKTERFVKTELFTNFTEELQDIGKDWETFSNNIAKSSPIELLHNMKLAHFSLSKDILKITDALVFIKFARSRRMSILDNFIVEGIVSKLAFSFNKASATILEAILENNNLRRNELEKINNPSFLTKVKNFFHKTIKNNFLKLIKVKKSVVKDSSDTRINNDYNKKKNQEKNADAHSIYYIRNQRSARYQRGQTKRILPKYLRKKISAAKKSIKSKKHTKAKKDRTNKQQTATNVTVKKPASDVVTNRSKTV